MAHVGDAASHTRQADPPCAGEPRAPTRRRRDGRADPRVRGGARPREAAAPPHRARSPRARGSLHRAPADALRRWADPRVRGGALVVVVVFLSMPGRSPRARGSPLRLLRGPRRRGPIPACAGEPGGSRRASRPWWADPRVRGRAPRCPSAGVYATDRSPRARGSPGPGRIVVRSAGPIPACAGEPTWALPAPMRTAADPRVRGGAPGDFLHAIRHTGRSPRARGSLLSQLRALASTGPIPACAGEPARHRRPAHPAQADPRVRGGAASVAVAEDTSAGRSPRARGSLARDLDLHAR